MTGITRQKMRKGGLLGAVGLNAFVFKPDRSLSIILDETSPASNLVVGTDALSSDYQCLNCGVAVSIVTGAGGGSDTAIFKLVGENQFGETVSEEVTVVTSASSTVTTQSKNAFRILKQVVPVSITGLTDADDRVQVGFECTDASNRIKIGLPVKLRDSGNLEGLIQVLPEAVMGELEPATNYSATYHTIDVADTQAVGVMYLAVFKENAYEL